MPEESVYKVCYLFTNHNSQFDTSHFLSCASLKLVSSVSSSAVQHVACGPHAARKLILSGPPELAKVYKKCRIM